MLGWTVSLSFCDVRAGTFREQERFFGRTAVSDRVKNNQNDPMGQNPLFNTTFTMQSEPVPGACIVAEFSCEVNSLFIARLKITARIHHTLTEYCQ